MSISKILVVSCLSILALSCTKASGPTSNVFAMNASPDEAFQRILTGLAAQGYSIDSVDPNARTITTIPKQVREGEFAQYVTLSGPPDRYDRGTIQLGIKVEDKDGQAAVTISATFRGHFTGKQHGTDSDAAAWTNEKSNGTLESSFFSAL